MCTDVSVFLCTCVVSIFLCQQLSSGESRSVSQLTRPERVCSVLHATKDTFKESHTIHLTVYTSDAQYRSFSTDNRCLLQPITDKKRVLCLHFCSLKSSKFVVYIFIVLNSQ